MKTKCEVQMPCIHGMIEKYRREFVRQDERQARKESIRTQNNRWEIKKVKAK